MLVATVRPRRKQLLVTQSYEDILASYLSLTRQRVQACIAYAAELARERIVAVPS